MYWRIVTGIIVIGVVVFALMLPDSAFAWIAACLCVLLIVEWVQLCNSSRVSQVTSCIAMMVCMLVFLWNANIHPYVYIFIVAGINCFWLGVVCIVLTRPIDFAKPLWGRFGPEIGAYALFGFWVTLAQLHQQHFWLLVTVLAGSAMFDTFALLWGREFGERKLSPRLSPKKTWEGVAGGALAAFTPIGIMALAGAKDLIPIYAWYIPAAAFAIVFAPFGDLFESLLKRLRGVKNSGRLLPGHGGLLDRVDSHLASVPCCAGFAVLFG